MRLVPRIIFASRWLQLPLYLGLIVAQGVYVYHFLVEVWHLLSHVTEYDENKIMLVVLGLIDVVMISNLLIMVIVGGYETFVSRLGIDNHPDEPEWLDHVNAGVLKVKLSMALIGISSIHLLKTFIDADAYHHVAGSHPPRLPAVSAGDGLGRPHGFAPGRRAREAGSTLKRRDAAFTPDRGPGAAVFLFGAIWPAERRRQHFRTCGRMYAAGQPRAGRCMIPG